MSRSMHKLIVLEGSVGRAFHSAPSSCNEVSLARSLGLLGSLILLCGSSWFEDGCWPPLLLLELQVPFAILEVRPTLSALCRPRPCRCNDGICGHLRFLVVIAGVWYVTVGVSCKLRASAATYLLSVTTWWQTDSCLSSSSECASS